MEILLPKISDIGNFKVLRVLPTTPVSRMTIGPFIFWDQMGPGEFLKDQGLDVRPHPHIGLETITYLFDGQISHRDSIGSFQNIVPGDVNVMCAGKGIVHSERTPFEDRAKPSCLFGIQAWLVLPLAREQTAPTFRHHGAGSLPRMDENGVRMRLILGDAFGEISPACTHSKAVYIDAHMDEGAAITLPNLGEEMGLYLLTGALEVSGYTLLPTQMCVFSHGQEVRLSAKAPCHFMILGGEATQGERFIWWNFVASDKTLLAQAALDWQEGRFAPVPGDSEYIPLPGTQHASEPNPCS